MSADCLYVDIEGPRAPGGHYSPAVVHNGIVYVSGQLPIPPAELAAPVDFGDQVRQVLKNLFAVLEAAGSDSAHLLKVTAYIVGMERWDEFNRTYAEIMGPLRPARSVAPVPALHLGYLIEVDALAAMPSIGG